jgi:hypothetical protein
MATITVNTNYALTLSDDVILADTQTFGLPITITLPITGAIGQRYYIKDKFGTTGTNPITIMATPKLIDNAGSFVLTVKKQSVLAHYDGTNWYIL